MSYGSSGTLANTCLPQPMDMDGSVTQSIAIPHISERCGPLAGAIQEAARLKAGRLG